MNEKEDTISVEVKWECQVLGVYPIGITIEGNNLDGNRWGISLDKKDVHPSDYFAYLPKPEITATMLYAKALTSGVLLDIRELTYLVYNSFESCGATFVTTRRGNLTILTCCNL